MNDLVVFFPAYAGGKFISNCLCLSKQFVPANATFNLTKVLDKEYRLDFVSKSLPPPYMLSNWLQYEFGEHNRTGAFYKLAKEMGLRCTRTMHGFDSQLLKQWEPCDVLKLTNYDKFRSLAQSLKNKNQTLDSDEHEDRYNVLCGKDWPDYKTFSLSGFDTRNIANLSHDIKNEINEFYPLGSTSYKTVLHDQNTIFNKEDFLEEMKKTYIALGLGDFDKEIVSIFYSRYATLHNI